MFEVLSLASCYDSDNALFIQLNVVLDAVTTSDLRHERMAMDGIPKYLVFEMYWYLLVTSQLASGMIGCAHEFSGSISCSDVEKIGKATLIIPCVEVMMVELGHMHQLSGVSINLGPKCKLFLMERMHQLMMSLKFHIVQVVQLYVWSHRVEVGIT